MQSFIKHIHAISSQRIMFKIKIFQKTYPIWHIPSNLTSKSKQPRKDNKILKSRKWGQMVDVSPSMNEIHSKTGCHI